MKNFNVLNVYFGRNDWDILNVEVVYSNSKEEVINEIMKEEVDNEWVVKCSDGVVVSDEMLVLVLDEGEDYRVLMEKMLDDIGVDF